MWIRRAAWKHLPTTSNLALQQVVCVAESMDTVAQQAMFVAAQDVCPRYGSSALVAVMTTRQGADCCSGINYCPRGYVCPGDDGDCVAGGRTVSVGTKLIANLQLNRLCFQ